jgi:predicted RNase H-related nuclease YkuK (DUF458 family)
LKPYTHNVSPTSKIFFAAHDIDEPSPNERELFKEIIREWNTRSDYAEAFFSKLDAQTQKPNERASKSREEIVAQSRGIAHLNGKIRVKRSGPYITIFCEDRRDYSAFYHGGHNSIDAGDGGTYHAKMAFSITDETSAVPIWVDKTKPPPRRKKEEFTIPVLLMSFGTNPPETLEKITFIHEQQHLINQLFAKIYGSAEKTTGTSLERLKDEIIAGVREGEAAIQIKNRLQAGGTYDYFIQAENQETNDLRDKILKETQAALSTREAREFFDTEETRALLAFHLMYAKPGGIARRIDTVTSYLKRQLLSDVVPESEGPIDIQNLADAHSKEFRAKILARERTVKEKFQQYKTCLKEFVLHPSQKRNELQTKKEAYLMERASLVHDLSLEAPEATFTLARAAEETFVKLGPPPRAKKP